MTKHDSKTADELILDNAPDGATHVEIESSGDLEYWRLKGGLFEWYHLCSTSQDYIYSFQKVDSESMKDYHSLADITELVELRKKNTELESHNLGLTKTLVEFEKDREIRDIEQQAKGATDICNKALAITKEMSALRSESYKAGITALAYAIGREDKQLKDNSQ